MKSDEKRPSTGPRGVGPRKWGRPPNRDRKPAAPAVNPLSIDDGIVRLFGVHVAEAVLANPARVIGRVLATDNAERRLAEPLKVRDVTPERVSPRDLDRMLGEDTVHQGILIETEPLPEPELADLAERAIAGGPLILLDHVTDPHNVGAILRSAAAFGACGLIMTRRHSPPLNGTLAKSASGALELIPIALVQNLAKAMEELKEQGVRLLGLDGDAPHDIESEDMRGPIALVLGAEGKGMRDLTGQTCDRLVRISTADALASLNVSNAAAVALHAIHLGRKT